MTTILPRRGTAAEWTAANPVLAMGELGYETDTTRWKRGDGATAWNALAYYQPAWNEVTGKPAVIAAGADQAAARAAIDSPRTSAAFPVFAVSTFYGGTLGQGDDTACIQATLDAANAAGGGLVILPPKIDGNPYHYSQIVIPRFVRISGRAWHTFGANGQVARLQQLPGVNDDSIIFSDNGDTSTPFPWAGPAGLTDLVLRGAAGATAGHAINFRMPDGRLAGAQDVSTFERIQTRGFAGSGIYVRKASPLSLSNIAGLYNGRYTVEIEDPSATPEQINQVVLREITGDGNMGGAADGGGATLLLKTLKAEATAVSVYGVKSEYRVRSTIDGGDGAAMGNFNAVIIDDCSCAISLTGVEHISNASQSRKPGDAIKIVGPSRPNLIWQSVAVRGHHVDQTVGPVPYMVYDSVSVRGSDAPHGLLGSSVEVVKSDQIATQLDTERSVELISGESTMSRRNVITAGIGGNNGVIRLSYFTARKTETISSVRVPSGSTASVGATLQRVGVYEEDQSGNLTLVAAVASDTSMWTSTNTSYIKALSTSFIKRRGARYAIGVLVVGATTAPTFMGQAALNSTELAAPPKISGALTGQTDLPSTISSELISATSLVLYGVVVP